MARAPGEAGRDDAGDVEAERRFNDLRREFLDHRIKLVDRWLIVMAIILTVGGYLGFDRFREIEVEARGNVDKARGHAEEVRKLAEEVRKLAAEIQGMHSRLKGMTAEVAAAEPDKAHEAARSAQADPSASLIARAVSAAILFQQEGNIQAAIKKWRAVANAVDGTDNELGARAWFSVGYLHGKQSRFPEAIVAYDEAIRLNRGMEEAFINRGNAKYKLGRTEEAIADFSQAIQQNPDYTDAYFNRAQVRFILGYKDEARRDFERARALARAASDEAKADEVSREIERLFGGGDP